ncbi:MAG: DinB family protein [Ignavibacteria bacterium]|nr:DinB family protein [Ignavibacteria bacterium]
MKNDLITEFESAFADLEAALEKFEENKFNVIPFEGSWSAAQTADHLLKANSGAAQTMLGSTKDTSREPDANEETIRSFMLDLNTKMISPEFILPSLEPIEKETMLENTRVAGNRLRNILLEENITKTCTDFALPGLGELTRYEWICFAVCHTKRHTHQINNIFKILEK